MCRDQVLSWLTCRWRKLKNQIHKRNPHYSGNSSNLKKTREAGTNRIIRVRCFAPVCSVNLSWFLRISKLFLCYAAFFVNSSPFRYAMEPHFDGKGGHDPVHRGLWRHQPMQTRMLRKAALPNHVGQSRSQRQQSRLT